MFFKKTLGSSAFGWVRSRKVDVLENCPNSVLLGALGTSPEVGGELAGALSTQGVRAHCRKTRRDAPASPVRNSSGCVSVA